MAWIQISGIGVDYPVVQGKDDEHYLHYIFGGKVNKAGSIFLDYRNLADFILLFYFLKWNKKHNI